MLGLGTWRMGEDAARASEEVRALRCGLDLGFTLVDTAEMYAEGGAEAVVGRAIEGRRDDVFLVSKVYPHNASRRGAVAACERSLRRLRTDRLDLFLLHWPGRHPIEETLAGFEELRAAGKVVDHGVSNFDVEELDAAVAAPGGGRVAVNQVLYNPGRRGIERRLLPRCRELGVVLMAYSPLEQGRLPPGPFASIAARHGVTAAQVALAWSIREPGVCTVVKAGSDAHLREAAAVPGMRLDAHDLAAIDGTLPRPERDVPLECL